MKKREKKLGLSKETLRDLDAGKDLKAVLGGAEGVELSCTIAPSTAGGSRLQCC